MTSPEHFLYFAYGSNLLSRRLIERTPSAVKVDVGHLRGHELRWHKSGSDGSGKCDAFLSTDESARIFGAVYKIHLSEKHVLDEAEALGVGYEEKQVLIEASERPLNALLYYAIQLDSNAIPYDWYHNLVVSGAREHNLPAIYLAKLKSMQTKPDQNQERSNLHFGLTNAA